MLNRKFLGYVRAILFMLKKNKNKRKRTNSSEKEMFLSKSISWR